MIVFFLRSLIDSQSGSETSQDAATPTDFGPHFDFPAGGSHVDQDMGITAGRRQRLPIRINRSAA
jgi:hypothetical protein